MRYLDLSQTFSNNMPVYPGDSKPGLVQSAFLDKDGAVNHRLTTSMHVGTHMDAPMHMIAGEKKISDFGPEKFFGRGVLVDARGETSADVNLLAGADIRKGDIVLVMFGWSEKFRDPEYYGQYPELTQAFAQKLVDLKVSIVGMDTPGPDYPPFLAHKLLLGHEILIIENLANLEALVQYPKFEIIAIPLKLETDAAPCRVVAKI